MTMEIDAKSAKAAELMEFLQAHSARLRMNPPTPVALQETMEFLSERQPGWETQISHEEFARILQQRHPELRFEWSGAEAGAAAELEDEPATDKQIAYLKVLEVPIPEYLGLRQASDLIDQWKDRMSAGQKRRLDFYKVKYDPKITREQATALIDAYKEKHPESEAAYQEWKTRKGLA
jgi:hypothetical protein